LVPGGLTEDERDAMKEELANVEAARAAVLDSLPQLVEKVMAEPTPGGHALIARLAAAFPDHQAVFHRRPAARRQLFVGTNESGRATLLRWETEMLRGFDCVQRIPSRSQYSQNSPRMSADRFEKNQRG
jgi:hypothetical protein